MLTPRAPITIEPKEAHIEFTITFPKLNVNFSKKTGMLRLKSGPRNGFENEQFLRLILNGFFFDVREIIAMTVSVAWATIVETGSRSIALSASKSPRCAEILMETLRAVLMRRTRVFPYITCFVFPRLFKVAK